MNVYDAFETLKKTGQDIEFKTLRDRSDYFMAIGFLKGTLEGLLLQVPKSVREKLESKTGSE